VAYAFEGEIVRVLPVQLERWRKAFPEIPDVVAELARADAYLVDHPSRDGKWFHRIAGWLARSNGQLATDKRTARQREIDAICPPEIYAGLQ
jgi:hypothetical protein